MKYRLTKPEEKFLQKMLNAVYSFNVFEKAFLMQFFPKDLQIFEKLYPVLLEVVQDKNDLSKMVPKDQAYYNLGQSGIIFIDIEYFEAIYLQQQQYTIQFPAMIKSPATALTAVDEERTNKNNIRYSKLKKAMWYMLAANAILGIWLLIKWS